MSLTPVELAFPTPKNFIKDRYCREGYMPVLAPPAGGRSGILPARVNFQQGEALLEREHYQEALEEFEKGLEKDPKNVTAYINKGLAQHALLGRLNDELHAYNQALAFDWTNVTAWQNKIVIRKTPPEEPASC